MSPFHFRGGGCVLIFCYIINVTVNEVRPVSSTIRSRTLYGAFIHFHNHPKAQPRVVWQWLLKWDIFFQCISNGFFRFVTIASLQILLGFEDYSMDRVLTELSVFQFFYVIHDVVLSQIWGVQVHKLSDGYHRSTCLLSPIQPFCCQMCHLFLASMMVTLS